MEIRRINVDQPEEANRWDEWVRRHPLGSCFHSTGWARALRDGLGLPCSVFGFFDEARLLGGVALSEFGKLGITGVRRPFGTPYCQPLFDVSLDPQTADRFHREAIAVLRKRYGIVSITYSFSADPPPAWLRSAAQVRDKTTYLLALDDLDRVWQGFKGELRTNIRKAVKSGVTVKRTRDVADFCHYYDQLFQSKGRKVPFTPDRLQVFTDALHSSDLGAVYEARGPAGDFHAATVIAYDERTAFYLLSATHPENRLSGANSLLLWEVFRDLQSPRRQFDMVGANIPAIARFKKRFGGRLVHYAECTCYRSFLIKALAQIRSRLPLP